MPAQKFAPISHTLAQLTFDLFTSILLRRSAVSRLANLRTKMRATLLAIAKRPSQRLDIVRDRHCGDELGLFVLKLADFGAEHRTPLIDRSISGRNSASASATAPSTIAGSSTSSNSSGGQAVR